MGIKNWMNRRKEQKECQERFEALSEDELQELHHTEKTAYLEVAKKQVTYRGKINAYKDFPIAEDDRKEIDMEDDFVNEMDSETDSNEANYEESEIQELQDRVPEPPELNNEAKSHVYQTIRQM